MDQKRLTILIDQCYAAALAPEAWQDCLNGLVDGFGEAAGLHQFDDRTAMAGVSWIARLDPVYIESYVAHFAELNPWMPAIAHARTGHLVLDLEPAVLEASEFYNDWLRPQGLYHNLGCVAQKCEGRATHISVLRSKRRGPFDEADVRAFRELTPHLTRAVELGYRLADAQAQRDAATQALDQLAVGVLLLDRNGRVRLANREAERLLGEDRGLALRHGRLRSESPDLGHRFEHLVSEATPKTGDARRGAGGVLAVQGRSGRRLAVFVSPLHSDERFGLREAAAIVLLTDPDHEPAAFTPPMVIAELGHLYGFTPAESRLILGLLQGLPLAEVCERAGVATSTGRTQLKHMLWKTGQTRQIDLVRYVAGNPVVRSLLHRKP